MVGISDARQLFRGSGNTQDKLFQLDFSLDGCGQSVARRRACPLHPSPRHRGACLQESNPMYHIFVIPFREQLLGGSGPYITGGRPHVPPIVDWPRKTERRRTISLYRSRRVEKKVFPQQDFLSRVILLALG